jgi:hypothetical protein
MLDASSEGAARGRATSGVTERTGVSRLPDAKV